MPFQTQNHEVAKEAHHLSLDLGQFQQKVERMEFIVASADEQLGHLLDSLKHQAIGIEATLGAIQAIAKARHAHA